MDRTKDELPINPLPWVVWLLAVPVLAIEGLFGLGAKGVIGGPGAIGWRSNAIEQFGFFDSAFDWMLENRIFPVEHLVRFVTYPFVHASFTHALFVAVFILALGKFIGEVFRPWAVLVVFFGSAIAGACAYGLALDDGYPLIGGYPAVYGLIGGFTFVRWAILTMQGANSLPAFRLIGILLAVQLLFSVLFGGNSQWLADVAGFVAGFLLSILVSPGGLGRALRRIRGQ